jgi:hypothetical protein
LFRLQILLLFYSHRAKSVCMDLFWQPQFRKATKSEASGREMGLGHHHHHHHVSGFQWMKPSSCLALSSTSALYKSCLSWLVKWLSAAAALCTSCREECNKYDLNLFCSVFLIGTS